MKVHENTTYILLTNFHLITFPGRFIYYINYVECVCICWLEWVLFVFCHFPFNRLLFVASKEPTWIKCSLSLFKYQPNHNPHLLFGYLQRGTAREFFFHSHNQLIDANLSMFSFRIFNQNTSCKLCCYGSVLCMPCTKPNRQFTIGENSI